MGNVSWLRKLLNCPENCKINWDAADVEKLCREYVIKLLYKGEDCFCNEEYEKDDKGRPRTLADLAKVLSNTKFIGYLDNNYVESLQELCRILEPCGSFPRLYYEYEGFDELWCMEFHPGTTDILLSSYQFGGDLKRENIPPHHDDIKNYTNVAQEEYDEWDNINDQAREKVIANAVNSVDGWKPWQKLVKYNMMDEEKMLSLMMYLSSI
jgi:hypothetical protein